MSLHAQKPLVLVVGGAGNTGQPVVGALLEYGAFRVATLTRPASVSKPAVAEQKSKGVEVRLGDFAHDSPQQLEDALAGVDVLISLVSFDAVLDQKNMFQAAKKVGVKRIVPCDFGTACSPGVRAMYDDKLTIRSFARELGVPYTIIDVAWWMQLSLPYPLSGPDEPGIAGRMAEISREFFGSGNVKNAVTDVKDVGRFVARIIEDRRTIDNYVFCWAQELTLNEIYEIADRVSGQKLSDAKVLVSGEELQRRSAAGKVEYERDPDIRSQLKWHHSEYMYSIYVRGDNTLENAKSEGALDARELYPDFEPGTLEQYAREFYGGKFPQFYF